MKCPLCGERVVYEGATAVECVGVGCPNRGQRPGRTVTEVIDELKAKLERLFGQQVSVKLLGDVLFCMPANMRSLPFGSVLAARALVEDAEEEIRGIKEATQP